MMHIDVFVSFSFQDAGHLCIMFCQLFCALRLEL